MTPATRATALSLLAVASAFGAAALVASYLAAREPKPETVRARHLKAGRHRLAPGHEWLLWTVSVVVRFYRWDDSGPKSAVTFSLLFLTFACAIGVNQ